MSAAGSSGTASRPSGTCSASVFSAPPESSLAPSVSVRPGLMTFTRIPRGASSAANVRPMERTAALEAALEALARQINERYLLALRQARVETAPPVIALHRLTELVLEVKFRNRFAVGLNPDPDSQGPPISQEVLDGLDLLFSRLHAAGDITVSCTTWSRQVYLLPGDSPAPAPEADGPADEAGARVDLVVRTVLGALGGTP